MEKDYSTFENTITINRNYKDRVFRMLFGPEYKENLLSLYNALNETHYENVDDLTVTTLDDAIFMGMKNDVSCIIDQHAALFEHQSTWNLNMPLRGLFYIVRIYEGLVRQMDRDIYGRRLVKLPTPQYYVFYNGIEERPNRQTLRLSDAFEHPVEPNTYEWTANVININQGCNEKLLKDCQTLGQYSEFIAMVRENYSEYNDLEKAAMTAVEDCIKQGILVDFLKKNKAEVTMSILSEFDVEKFKRTMRAEGYEDGVAEGEAKGKAAGLAEGEAIGIEKGKVEGKAEGAFLAARKAYEQKMVTAEQAALLADLPVEEFLQKISE